MHAHVRAGCIQYRLGPFPDSNLVPPRYMSKSVAGTSTDRIVMPDVLLDKNDANRFIDDVCELLFQLGMSVRPVVQLSCVIHKFMKVELFVFLPKTSYSR